MFCMLYAFFWVTPQHLKFICRRLGTLCLFHLHRQVDVSRMNWFILLTSTCLCRWNRQSVPKRRHINFRRRGVTQKKAYICSFLYAKELINSTVTLCILLTVHPGIILVNNQLDALFHTF